MSKRKDGRFTKSFTFQGKRYFVYAANNEDLFEAERKKREELEKGVDRRNNPSFYEYYERWSEDRRGQVTEATLRTQEKTINVIKEIKIMPLNKKFGDIKLKEITIEDLRELQKKLKENRQCETVNYYMALVKHIMSDATKQRLLDYNPCVLIKNYKRQEETARDTIHRALTIEEQKKFFSCSRYKESAYANIMKFAINTGMRAGEIGALKSTDIYDGLIHVQRTITRNEYGIYIIGKDAKTKAGKRVIPLNDQIEAILEEQKKCNKILFGSETADNGLLFTATEGGILNVTAIDRDIKKICQSVNIEPITMHAFRATFATRALEAGMAPKILQEILGHKSFSMTMDLYGHVLNDTKINAMNGLKIDI
jgi:integrase